MQNPGWLKILEKLEQGRGKVGKLIDQFQFKEATRQFMDIARFANKYFNDQEPWRTRKENPAKCATTLNLCTQAVYSLAILMHPILPFTSEKIWKMLKLRSKYDWQNIGKLEIEEGHLIGDIDILFEKIPDKTIQGEIEKLRQMQESDEPEKPKEKPKKMITIDDFKKVELKTARVLSAEKVEGADKLLKMQIQVGKETRQLVAGIAQQYKPEELIDKTIVIVANLQPAKIRGIESQGMLLAAIDGDNLAVITSDKPIADGKEVS